MVDLTDKVRLHTREELEKLLAECIIAKAKIPGIKRAIIAESEGRLGDEPGTGVYTITPYGFIWDRF